ncbi:hypothetical protein GEOBRER4_n2840 [Citrifermentans bremense]|uniref:Uncharacterized protein n=1 Tax=Citrifermentans bremense TaxID=60035 RepID=A0A7R7FSF4_9BACT|nr:hypothetical protein GEOBRER4_n2840 [Citrifermentans bremense]
MYDYHQHMERGSDTDSGGMRPPHYCKYRR